MKNENTIKVFGVTGIILLIPLLAMQFTDEVAWTLSDFIIMGSLLLGIGFLIVWAAGAIKNLNYRVIAIGLVVLAFLLIWVDLAVGIFNIPGVSGS